MEKSLKPVWRNLNFLTRGRRYGTVEVRMDTKEKVQPHSIQPPRADNIVLLPIYMERRISRITIKNIRPEIQDVWLIGAITLGEVKILEADVTDDELVGKTLKILIEAEPYKIVMRLSKRRLMIEPAAIPKSKVQKRDEIFLPFLSLI